MKRSTIWLCLLALALLPRALRADSIAVGQLTFGNPISVSQGFMVTNLTGPLSGGNGCNSNPGYPVCESLAFTNVTLTVTLADGSQLVRTPDPGFSFSPGSYIYGDNPGDDPAQSFEFDPALTIVSAEFTGQLSAPAFTLADGTFVQSNGIISLAAPFTIAPGDALDAVDLVVTTMAAAGPTTVPEPATLWLMAAGALAGAVWLRRRQPQTEVQEAFHAR